MQVQLEGSQLLNMCKKVKNAAVHSRVEFLISDRQDGGCRLPDHFPHFVDRPEVRLYESSNVVNGSAHVCMNCHPCLSVDSPY